MVKAYFSMVSILKTYNDAIGKGTEGKANLFEKAEYHGLAKIFEQ